MSRIKGMGRGVGVLGWAVLLGPTGIVAAEVFHFVGGRALGMGGAHVAMAEGALAQHWNPAGMALGKGFDLDVPLGGGYEFTATNLIRQIDKVKDLNDKLTAADANNQSLSLSDYKAFLEFLAEAGKPENGVLVDADGAGRLGIKKWYLSVSYILNVTGDPVPDLANINVNSSSGTLDLAQLNGDASDPAGFDTATRDALATAIGDTRRRSGGDTGGKTDAQLANILINGQRAAGKSDAEITREINAIVAANDLLKQMNAGTGPLTANDSKLVNTFHERWEIALGRGFKLLGDLLMVGGNAKIQAGRANRKEFGIREGVPDANAFFTDLGSGARSAARFTVDVGALTRMKFAGRQLRGGLVIKNLIPTFFPYPLVNGQKTADDFALRPQFRLGAAANPLVPWWWLALDLDLTANPTTIAGYSSRILSLGTELNLLKIVPLRAGAYKNTLRRAPWNLTFGTGLTFGVFNLEIAGAISKDRIELKDDATGKVQRLPATIHGMANLSFRL